LCHLWSTFGSANRWACAPDVAWQLLVFGDFWEPSPVLGETESGCRSRDAPSHPHRLRLCQWFISKWRHISGGHRRTHLAASSPARPVVMSLTMLARFAGSGWKRPVLAVSQPLAGEAEAPRVENGMRSQLIASLGPSRRNSSQCYREKWWSKMSRLDFRRGLAVHVSGFWKESSLRRVFPQVEHRKYRACSTRTRGSPEIFRIILVWLQITNVNLCPLFYATVAVRIGSWTTLGPASRTSPRRWTRWNITIR
jgi:hypothetical protein